MRILIRLPNWLGDGVMFSASFEALKREFSSADFVLVGSRATCGLFEEDKRVCGLIVDESKKGFFRMLKTYQLARSLVHRFGQFDIAISFTNHFYSAFLLFCTRAKMRIGYEGFLRTFLLSHPIKKQSFSHQVLSYGHLLSPLGIGLEDLDGLSLSFEEREGRSDARIGRIGIASGAAFGSSKMWPLEYFASVGMHFLKLGYEVVLFGSGKEASNNAKIVELIEQNLGFKDENLRDLSNQTDIPKLCKEIAKLDVFLSNDSGPMHIAAALKTPLVALFGPTHPTYCLPYGIRGDRAIIINQFLSCSPCQKRICPLGHHQCMRSIKPEIVIESIKKLL